MTKLSVVIITYNEERNIARCLESVKDIADDIVVVDSFSTDKTEEICKKYGARFVTHAFEGHIQQKNWAITQALHPHILSLDADEALDLSLKESIKKVKKNWVYDGYYMKRLTNYIGTWIYHCGWFPDKKLRLWDSTKGKWGGENPHDTYEMLPKATTSELCDGNILHYSYYSLYDHYRKADYFSKISAQEKFKKDKKSFYLYLIIKPAIKFLTSYFWQLGFLDGKAGFLISKIAAYSSYLKYKYLLELQRQKKTN